MEFENGKIWRDHVTNQLRQEFNITVFDPYYRPFINDLKEDDAARNEMLLNVKANKLDIVHKKMRYIRASDLRICDICDFAIVRLNPETPSWGSVEELVTLNRAKKPIFIFVEGGRTKTPLWVIGMINPKYIFSSFEDIMIHLRKINARKTGLDGRWRILDGSFR